MTIRPEDLLLLDFELSEKLNPDLVDPRILPLLEQSSWNEDTAYPGDGRPGSLDLRRVWLETNTPDRTRPEILQCLVTSRLLKDIYPQGGLLMVHVNDSVIGEVPHFLFWKDAGKHCQNPDDPGQLRAAQKAALAEITSGKATFRQYGFVDLTGSQFNPGSKIVLIDPISKAYAAEWTEHIEREPTFARRARTLLDRFDTDLRRQHATNLEGFRNLVCA